MTNLTLLILIPMISALAVLFCNTASQVRWVALMGSLIQLVLVGMLAVSYYAAREAGDLAPMLFEYRSSWYPAFHIEYHVGIDGISLLMLLMTAFVVVSGILLSFNIDYLTKEFFFLLLMLSMGAYGFFISLDLFTMFFFLEIAVIPKFLLIAIWGSGKKEYSAMKLALMLMAGSALVLVGILITYFVAVGPDGRHTFDLMQLAQVQLPFEWQRIIFPLLFVGFGVFTALFPFHTWVPDGHSSAPTAASMFLAGISMKLGGYGCLRVATYLMPEAAAYYSWVIVLLATIAIIYGAFATLMQQDLKYINAYSSVSHCGFILLGIGMLTKTALIGAVMQMVSHGVMTALFFGAIGMLYQRTHTRQVSELGGLLKTIPFISSMYIIAGLCSLGLPGFSGFVSEMTIFMGAWQREGMFYRVSTILACASIVVTAVYILRAAGKAVMGPIENDKFRDLQDATWNEKIASVLLTVAVLAIGLAPFWLIHLVSGDVQLIMDNLTRGALGN